LPTIHLQCPEGLGTNSSDAPFVKPRPLRLQPGSDLRRELERLVIDGELGSGFVVAGIGSIGAATIRLADDEAETVFAGSHEVLTLSGSLSQDGAHLHVIVASCSGQVIGGHLCYGNTVRTTAELLLLETTGWSLSRAVDEVTGYKELVVKGSTVGSGGSSV
jgi:predicted DNA-binding protein with PD1-like motif